MKCFDAWIVAEINVYIPTGHHHWTIISEPTIVFAYRLAHHHHGRRRRLRTARIFSHRSLLLIKRLSVTRSHSNTTRLSLHSGSLVRFQPCYSTILLLLEMHLMQAGYHWGERKGFQLLDAHKHSSWITVDNMDVNNVKKVFAFAYVFDHSIQQALPLSLLSLCPSTAIGGRERPGKSLRSINYRLSCFLVVSPLWFAFFTFSA